MKIQMIKSFVSIVHSHFSLYHLYIYINKICKCVAVCKTFRLLDYYLKEHFVNTIKRV